MNIDDRNRESRKEIYLAGGCFWGIEKYLSLVKGDCGHGSGLCKWQYRKAKL